MFPFGHGLSYTTFAFGNIVPIASLSSSSSPLSLSSDDNETVHSIYAVNVTNVGDVDSDLVVLGFISSPSLKSSPELTKELLPKQRLFDFERLNMIRVNETRSLKLRLKMQDVSFIKESNGERIVPESQWLLRIGEADPISINEFGQTFDFFCRY